MLLMPLPVLRILPGQLRAADDQQVLGVPCFGGLGEVEAAGTATADRGRYGVLCRLPPLVISAIQGSQPPGIVQD